MDPGGVPCARQELGVLTIGPRITRSLDLLNERGKRYQAAVLNCIAAENGAA